MGGVEAAKHLARERRGGDFDPALADVVEAEGDPEPPEAVHETGSAQSPHMRPCSAPRATVSHGVAGAPPG